MSVAQDVPFACLCGKVHGNIKSVAPNRGNHVVCYCKSCQTAANVLGQGDRLTDHGGTHVFQTIPSLVDFIEGSEHLACLRLSPKGLLRFYAACCNAPLFTMPDQPRFAIAGLNMDRIAEQHKPAFGPLRAAHATRTARNKPNDLHDYGLIRAAFTATMRAVMALIRRDSWAPFFNADGAIAPPVRVLTLDERRAHTPD